MMRNKKENIFNRYLLAKPTIRMVIEWPMLIVLGIIANIFSQSTIPFYPFSNIFGFVLLIMGIIIHGFSHKIHKQAHYQSDKIEKLITEGIYSKIRHPGYLGLMLMYLGVAFTWGFTWILIPAVLFVILSILTALKEEDIMKEKFSKEYEEYVKQVPWRFIPNLF